ncbi:hypothetical protein HYC85_010754 [Camellia sinensis]|uniref:Uncharacterized protein n=1 Tax=Camellia sinensis TaxID=4442 RepID=A0A7J7HIS6_CAMSI|nr:hypothetical protein HYC85_010754 [Camellia sinensis]
MIYHTPLSQPRRKKLSDLSLELHRHVSGILQRQSELELTAVAGKMTGPALAVEMTTCNMRNCTQSRPADHNSKSAAKPIQPMHGYSSSAPYVGTGAPSSMYMGVPPYGSSLFNGSSMSPYDIPFSGGSAYPYNYSSRLSGGSPWDVQYATPDGPLWLGMGMAMGHAGMAAKSDSNSKHKMPDGSWNEFYRKCLWVEKGPESSSSGYAHYGCPKVSHVVVVVVLPHLSSLFCLLMICVELY